MQHVSLLKGGRRSMATDEQNAALRKIMGIPCMPLRLVVLDIGNSSSTALASSAGLAYPKVKCGKMNAAPPQGKSFSKASFSKAALAKKVVGAAAKPKAVRKDFAPVKGYATGPYEKVVAVARDPEARKQAMADFTDAIFTRGARAAKDGHWPTWQGLHRE